MRSIAAFAIVIRPSVEEGTACTSGLDDPREPGVAALVADVPGAALESEPSARREGQYTTYDRAPSAPDRAASVVSLRRSAASPRESRRRPGTSDGLGDFAGLEAARADVGPGGLAVDDGADVLQVRVEAALCGDHRMAPVVPEARLLPANGANLRHRRGSVAATRRPSPRRGSG